MMANNVIKSIAGIRVKGVLAEKWGLVSWLTIPILIVFLMSLISGGGDSDNPRGELLVTDLDNSILSKLLTGGFSQGELSSWVGVKQVDQVTAEKIMAAGKASAWLTIGEGFTDDFLNQRSTSLRLVKNPAQTILPDLIESAMQLMVDAGGYVQQLFGDELKMLADSFNQDNFSNTEVSALSIALKARMEQFSDYMDPLLIELTEKVDINDGDPKATSSFGLLMFPGAVMMALLFSIGSLVMYIWADLHSGVISRLAGTGKGLSSYFWGQQLAVLAIFSLLVIVFMLLGGSYFKIPLMQWPIMMLSLVFAGLIMWQLFLALALLLASQKSANIVINASIFPVLMLGGSFFPFEVMPDWLAAIGIYLPNGWMVQAINETISTDTLQPLLLPFVGGLVIIVVFGFINQRLLKRFATKHNL